MSPREKNLLILFTVAGFLVVNFLAFSWYQRLNTGFRADLEDTKVRLDRAELNLANSELIAEQIDWLAERQPEPTAAQNAQSALQEFVEEKAGQAGLTIGRKGFLTVDESGTHFHRARVWIEVSGREQALYTWLHNVKSPDEFRATTRILMKPNDQDDTLIDCRAEIEQWFVPAEPGA